jgi:hypothetical protein
MKVSKKNILVLFGFLVLVFILGLYFYYSNFNKAIDDSKIRHQLYSLENVGWKSKKYEQKVDDIYFVATEVPIQYYILKNEGTQNLFNVDSIYQANKTERIYEFTFQQEKEKDLLKEEYTKTSYEDGVKYLSFSMEKDFYVVTSKNDTIPCSGVTYERNFKIAPFQKVMVYFSGIDPEEKVQLVYNDILFQKGLLKFKFKDTYKKIAQ